jgi:hypothetical protein
MSPLNYSEKLNSIKETLTQLYIDGNIKWYLAQVTSRLYQLFGAEITTDYCSLVQREEKYLHKKKLKFNKNLTAAQLELKNRMESIATKVAYEAFSQYYKVDVQSDKVVITMYMPEMQSIENV